MGGEGAWAVVMRRLAGQEEQVEAGELSSQGLPSHDRRHRVVCVCVCACRTARQHTCKRCTCC